MAIAGHLSRKLRTPYHLRGDFHFCCALHVELACQIEPDRFLLCNQLISRAIDFDWVNTLCKIEVSKTSRMTSFPAIVAMKRVLEIDVKLQQRVNVFFCFKLGWTHTQCKAALETVFGQATLHKSTTRQWYKAFRDRCTSLVDMQRAPREGTGTSAANVQAVRGMINLDKSITFAAIMRQTGLSQTSVHRIVTKELGLKLCSAKFLPNFLTPQHIVERFQHCSEMLQRTRLNPSFLKKGMTMDEAWCYQYDPELKRQASQWLQPGGPRPVHVRRTISMKKVMLVAFFDFRGMVHFEFLRGGTVDTPTFLGILSYFREALRVKRPRQTRLLHMDNAPAHGARDTKLHLLLTGQRTVPHPALSPDLAPSDYWLFPHIKLPLRGRQFPSLDALEDEVTHQIGLIPAAEYRETIFKKWPKCWACCMHRNGDYFEGRN